jgi:hypothetical protein
LALETIAKRELPEFQLMRPNEQRLSDAAAALDKWRGGAWRQINPVELNRLSVGV